MDGKIQFFKPEDFEDFCDNNSDYAEHCAEAANSKLELEGKVVYNVYNYMTSLDYGWLPHEPKVGSTYRALLVNIQPIEVCKHPKEKVNLRKHYVTAGLVLGEKITSHIGDDYVCECGKTVKPSGFEG